jgi:hypothetical protein
MRKIISYVLAIMTVGAFVLFVVLKQTSSFSISSFIPYQNMISEAILNTIIVSILSLVGQVLIQKNSISH